MADRTKFVSERIWDVVVHMGMDKVLQEKAKETVKAPPPPRGEIMRELTELGQDAQKLLDLLEQAGKPKGVVFEGKHYYENDIVKWLGIIPPKIVKEHDPQTKKTKEINEGRKAVLRDLNSLLEQEKHREFWILMETLHENRFAQKFRTFLTQVQEKAREIDEELDQSLAPVNEKLETWLSQRRQRR